VDTPKNEVVSLDAVKHTAQLEKEKKQYLYSRGWLKKGTVFIHPPNDFEVSMDVAWEIQGYMDSDENAQVWLNIAASAIRRVEFDEVQTVTDELYNAWVDRRSGDFFYTAMYKRHRDLG